MTEKNGPTRLQSGGAGAGETITETQAHLSSYQPGTTEWRGTISASKIAAIIGVSPWQDAHGLWLDMNGLGVERRVTEPIRRGIDDEAGILNRFFEFGGGRGWARNGAETMFKRDDLGFPALANLDDVGTDPDGNHFYVEVKSVRNDAEWGDPGTDQVPIHYLAQVQWGMHMTQGSSQPCHGAVVVKRGPFIDQYDEYPVAYNPQVAESLTRRAAEFYQSLSAESNPWPVTGCRQTYEAIRKQHPEIDRDTDWQIDPKLATAYVTALGQLEKWDAEVTRCKGEILRAMGTARRAMVADLVIAQRQPTRGGVTLVKPRKPISLNDLKETRNVA